MRFDEITIAGRRKRKNRKDRVNRMVQKHLHKVGRKVDEAEGKNTHLEHLEDEILNRGYEGVASRSIQNAQG